VEGDQKTKIGKKKKKTSPLRTSQGTWARSNVEKSHGFTEHLAKALWPHPSENEREEEEASQKS
jgi:hypothetical protein